MVTYFEGGTTFGSTPLESVIVQFVVPVLIGYLYIYMYIYIYIYMAYSKALIQDLKVMVTSVSQLVARI